MVGPNGPAGHPAGAEHSRQVPTEGRRETASRDGDAGVHRVPTRARRGGREVTTRATGPHGRIPPAENAAPPVWFGLAFALVGGGLIVTGIGGIPGMAGGGGLVFVGLGSFFGSIGIAMTLTTLRAGGARQATHARDGSPAVDVFTRSPMRILVDVVLTPLGGIAFLVGAVLVFAVGSMGVIASATFVFFALLMLSAAAVTVRRGVRRAVAEVGPNGIWTPELPWRLAWDEIVRLEIEVSRGAAGQGVARYRRLGIWPADPDLAARAPGHGATRLVSVFASVMNKLAPDAAISDPAKMAPFGVSAYEIEQDFSELLRSVGRYATIVGVRSGVGEPLETAPGVPVPPATMPDGLLGAILENVANAAGAAPPVSPTRLDEPTGRAPRSVADAAGAAEPVPSRTFLRRPGSAAGRVLGAVAWSMFMIVVPAIFVGSRLLIGPALLDVPLLLGFDLIAIAFVGIGVAALLEVPGRWRMATGDPVLATVDEAGIEMRGMGRLPWSEIEGVRVAGSWIPAGEARSTIRRLEIAPRDRRLLAGRPWPDRALDGLRSVSGRALPGRRRRGVGAFALDLDLLEDPEGLLDEIACHCLVDGS
jgi:hypothetical protein